MCFIKYHVSENRLSIVELVVGVETPHCVSAYRKPAWHFDAKFVNGKGNERAKVQKKTLHGRFLEVKNSAYYCPYDLSSNKITAILVYKIRNYDGTVHDYLSSCGFGDNHSGI